jgi:hypothetical protein
MQEEVRTLAKKANPKMLTLRHIPDGLMAKVRLFQYQSGLPTQDAAIIALIERGLADKPAQTIDQHTETVLSKLNAAIEKARKADEKDEESWD